MLALYLLMINLRTNLTAKMKAKIPLFFHFETFKNNSLSFKTNIKKLAIH